MAIQRYPKLENTHFSLTFFEHCYLTYFPIFLLECSIRIGETHTKGSVSQICNIGLSFCFVTCRKLMFVKRDEKSQKLPVFCHKIKTKA